MNARERLKAIDESTLSRVWQMVYEGYHFGILSASRGELLPDVNAKRTDQLRDNIRDARFGFVLLNGVFIENEGKPDEKRVEEKSFFIPYPGDRDSEHLTNFILSQLPVFQQESAIFKHAAWAHVVLLFADGSFEQAGRFHPDRIAKIYSEFIRGPHAGRKFIFESATALSWSRGLVEMLADRIVE